MKRTNEEIAQDLLDAQAEGEGLAAEYINDRVVHLEDLAELGIMETLPVLQRLQKIAKILE